MATSAPAEQGRVFVKHPHPIWLSAEQAELRWKIWAFNLPGPRIVSIRCGPESLPSSPSLDGCLRMSPSSSYYSSGCTSPAAIPTNLHVCHESRREALRRYRHSFGIARQPGQTFFDPEQDVLYFGPRDGFMASEANLRTTLSLCDPAELAQVRRVAINDSLFWVYENAWHQPRHHQLPQRQQQQQQHLHYHADNGQQHPWQQQQQQQQQQQRTPNPSTALTAPHPTPAAYTLPAAAAMTHAAIAASLLMDVLRLVGSRLPGLRELIFIPRDENPVYSGDSCLVEPSMVQGRMARQIREAMTAVFGTPDDGPWAWRIMTLSADPHPPVYEKQVLGWHVVDGEGGGGGGGGGCGGGSRGRRGQGTAAGRWDAELGLGRGRCDGMARGGCRGATTRLGVLQESVRRRFMEMEMEMQVQMQMDCGQ
ncbi:hypothetical protein VPNG_03937 [Cytospora leucostoma]|uniref:2EXR domain-containing protein n=1 Tax=Cytospora leucostoma TaxID=1230097 RepID=A0A423XE62_9PEZI|nr:hypothetical protein VPNG_03937 [Cytospora leucostoma]